MSDTKLSVSSLLDAILARIGSYTGPDRRGWITCRCPLGTHADTTPSFGIHPASGRYKCQGCGASGTLADLARRLGILPGLTLEQYARAKRLPTEFLRSLGLRNVRLGQGDDRHDAVAIPYLDERGEEVAVRYRHALTGERRFTWRRGSKVLPYGLHRLAEARSAGRVVVVEGESDSQTLWYVGIPAIGLPGAGTWRLEWAAYLDGIATVYVVQEPDEAGVGMVERLAKTPGLRERLRAVSLPDGLKDPSELWLYLPDDLDDEARKAAFRERFEAALAAAVPAAELEARAAMEAAAEALAKAGPLATGPDILGKVVRTCADLGLVGEERAAKLLYLVLTTRLLDRPVSAKIAGPAASGKSFSAEVVLKLFPPEAYHDLSATSEHGLVYETEPLQHRFLVLFEAAGLSSDFATYAVRSLLSEGRLRYLTVEKTAEGLRPRLVEREGPTGLLVTTTRVSLDPELETRLFTIPTDDSPAQTCRVLQEQARRAKGEVPTVDLERWHALQRWLASQPAEVVVPFADVVAAGSNPAAIRLRRDFPAVLSLIKAHALLHQASRPRDERGRIVATLDDYRAVHALVADLLQHGAQTGVPHAVREAVEAVQELYQQTEDPVTVTQVAKRLGIDKAAASRRIRQAVEAGWLVNLEDRRGYPARLVPGDALPDGRPILPDPDAVAQAIGNEAERAADAGVCACSSPRINGSTPPAPTPENRVTTALEPLTRSDQHPVNTLNGSPGTVAAATHRGVDAVDGVLTTADQRFAGRNDGLLGHSDGDCCSVDARGPAHTSPSHSREPVMTPSDGHVQGTGNPDEVITADGWVVGYI